MFCCLHRPTLRDGERCAYFFSTNLSLLWSDFKFVPFSLLICSFFPFLNCQAEPVEAGLKSKAVTYPIQTAFDKLRLTVLHLMKGFPAQVIFTCRSYGAIFKFVPFISSFAILLSFFHSCKDKLINVLLSPP